MLELCVLVPFSLFRNDMPSGFSRTMFEGPIEAILRRTEVPRVADTNQHRTQRRPRIFFLVDF